MITRNRQLHHIGTKYTLPGGLWEAVVVVAREKDSISSASDLTNWSGKAANDCDTSKSTEENCEKAVKGSKTRTEVRDEL